MLAQTLGKVWVWNCVCYGEARREILAGLCHSLSPGVKTPELSIGTVVTLQEQGRCIDWGPREVGRAQLGTQLQEGGCCTLLTAS